MPGGPMCASMQFANGASQSRGPLGPYGYMRDSE